MKDIFIFFIRAYQKTLSPDHGVLFFWKKRPTCRFYPSCSEYAIRAIEKHGTAIGIIMAIRRIARCTPCGGAEIDEP